MSDDLAHEVDVLKERVRKLEQRIAVPPPVIVPVPSWDGFAMTAVVGWNTPVTVLASVVTDAESLPRWLVRYDDGREYLSEVVEAVYTRKLPDSECPEAEDMSTGRPYGRLELPSFSRG